MSTCTDCEMLGLEIKGRLQGRRLALALKEAGFNAQIGFAKELEAKNPGLKIVPHVADQAKKELEAIQLIISELEDLERILKGQKPSVDQSLTEPLDHSDRKIAEAPKASWLD